MGYGNFMSDKQASFWSWIAGALAVVIAAALYLWLTAPTDSILSETYTVM